VNLEYDAETDELIDRAAAVFARAAPIERLRSASAKNAAWSALHEAGWTSLGADIVAGDLDVGAAVGIYREAGRQLLIDEFVTAGYLIPALLAHADASTDGFPAARSEFPGVLLGDGRAETYSIGPIEHGFCFGINDPLGPVYRLNRAVDGQLILELSVNGTVGSTPVAGLSPSMGTVSVSNGVWQSKPLRLNENELDEIRRTEMLLHSAALVGCAEAALAMTRDYTLQRVQFGVAIGQFQAIQHALADVLAANEVAWSALLCACAANDNLQYRCDVARVLAVEAALGSVRAAAQFHGGIGFTTEANVHHYLKAALDGSARFGSTDAISMRIGRALVSQSSVSNQC
jgi:Acyl-CoA dehydrogenase, C-terminal domain